MRHCLHKELVPWTPHPRLLHDENSIHFDQENSIHFDPENRMCSYVDNNDGHSAVLKYLSRNAANRVEGMLEDSLDNF